jgi:hypothetical protein
MRERRKIARNFAKSKHGKNTKAGYNIIKDVFFEECGVD